MILRTGKSKRQEISLILSEKQSYLNHTVEGKAVKEWTALFKNSAS